MRVFCLLLILANALFFGWAQLIDVSPASLDRSRAAPAPPPPRIVLAREASGGEPERATAAPVRNIQPPRVDPVRPANDGAQVARADARDATPFSCVSVGPFPELADGAQAQSALRAAGLEPRQRIERGEVWVGYWVSVRDLANREAAEAALQLLTDRGVGDAYILPGQDAGHVLSLGVFSDYQRAQRRAEQIRSHGLEPQIADRKRAGSVYWIDVDLSEASQTLDVAMFQPEPGKIMRLELRACSRAEGTG